MNFLKRHNISGFTLLELLVAVAIIAILSVTMISTIRGGLAKARDAKRITDMLKIKSALLMYKEKFGKYPDNSDVAGPGAITDNGDYCGSWDVGYHVDNVGDDTFIKPLSESGIMPIVPGDPRGPSSVCVPGTFIYRYYKYKVPYKYSPAPNEKWCTSNKGDFYVLQVLTMESVTGVHPQSPGFRCADDPLSAWNGAWVTGAFEK